METPKGEVNMYMHAKLFAVAAVSALFSHFLGCGSSQHTYTLSTLTSSMLDAITTESNAGVYITGDVAQGG